MTRESDIHKALVARIELLGGEVRRVSWLGRIGAPDVLVMLPFFHAFVEEKRPGEKPKDHQIREHARLAAAGFTVYVISTFAEIDTLFPLPT